MIKITITKVTTEKYTAIENLLVKETPTGQTKQKDYGNGVEIAMAKEWAPTEVARTRDITQKLLDQEIAEEAGFSLPAVIKAINGL